MKVAGYVTILGGGTHNLPEPESNPREFALQLEALTKMSRSTPTAHLDAMAYLIERRDELRQ
jgi:hypothetical protein